MAPHTCHAHQCDIRVPPAMFMCKPHWNTLPRVYRFAILREYRPGQEIDKSPSQRYLAVAFRAIGWLASRGSDEASAKATARYREFSDEMRAGAIHDGLGDPLVFADVLDARQPRATP